MKRFLLLLVASAAVSLTVSAQTKIQDSFFGVRLGEGYKEVCRTDIVKSQCRRSSGAWRDKTKPRHEVEDVWFGGFKWNACAFYFDEEAHRLYQLRFYDAYKNEDVSRTTYEEVLEMLDKKYKDRPGIVRESRNDWDDSKYESVTYTDENGGVCKLVREYTTSISGHYFNYVFLYYYNKNVKMGVEHSYMEEL